MLEFVRNAPDLSLDALEYSSQELTQRPVWDVEIQPDIPLYGLAEDAHEHNNENYAPYRHNKVRHPFSNDTCTARYFKETLPRTLTQEYQEADSRVALLIGESGLAANLRYIPEETIILPDICPDMNKFMNIYIDSLRTASSKEQWLESLRKNGPYYIDECLNFQKIHWEMAREPHPATDDDAFYEAQKLAGEKVIVPLQADILDSQPMDWLAEQLKERQASVTFMNLTNLLPCLGASDFIHAFHNLKKLPITSEAPILATGADIHIRPRSPEEDRMQSIAGSLNHAVGPFFGMNNLSRAYNQGSYYDLGAVGSRDYIYGTPEEDLQNITQQMLESALRGFFDFR